MIMFNVFYYLGHRHLVYFNSFIFYFRQLDRKSLATCWTQTDNIAPPSDDAITLPKLNHEELESFFELLYSGDLTEERMSKHVYSLSLAADKYGISYLQKLCERHMHKSLSSSNALDVLEVADTCSFLMLKEKALNYIVKNMQEIIFSAEYDTFALKNPHLSVQITRASLMDAKRNCAD
ncbi:BTB/POZ domain-containing protein At3g56230-like [Argentina anserina]|uniref:BTB/POZ domain-containing protein At3g56230-like n=1 Tax=Argentina anserina TaxID=57926 RepID=UPI002176510C|nr:BTB/POZ domain-containing protein At3g56230-like [Potentilla anserina]